MPHALMQKNPHNPNMMLPLLVSLRYRCECANNEVVSIQIVLDPNISEDNFLWTMRQLYGDLFFEVQQHITENLRKKKGQSELKSVKCDEEIIA
jgi:hypothetical protein